MDNWSQRSQPGEQPPPPPPPSSPGPVPSQRVPEWSPPGYQPAATQPVPPYQPEPYQPQAYQPQAYQPQAYQPQAYQPQPFPPPAPPPGGYQPPPPSGYEPPPPPAGFEPVPPPPSAPPAGFEPFGQYPPAPEGWPPPGPVAPPAGRVGRRRGWPGVLALVLVLVLGAGVGVQTWQLLEISSQLDQADQQLSELTQGQAYGGERLDVLEDRAAELEQQAGEAFNSEEIAAAVVPSVFMVVAGDFTGTAFAVGPETDQGGTNLFTNYHVIQSIWEQGGREVTLERTNQRYPAEIVEVDPEVDVAWLQTETEFRGLQTSTEEVRSGQPIIAVGAPLGLTDVVTTGVVSSPSQDLPDGTGPWIQFDAAVNPGNSGGPVINSEQQVVGIATRKGNDAEALGFAVPIDVACNLFEIC
jgi:hypothetical protein